MSLAATTSAEITAAPAATTDVNPAASTATEIASPPPDVSRELALIHRERKKLEEQKKANAEKLKKYDDYEARRAKAKEDPESYLKEGGLTLDELIQWKLKQGEPLTAEEQAKLLDEKVNKTVEDRLREAEEKKSKEAEQNRISEDISIFKESVAKEIISKPEQYETLAYFGDEARDQVTAICAQAIAERPELYKDRESCEKLIPRVCELLETELFEKEKEKALKLQKLRKALEPSDPHKKDTPPAQKDTPAPQTTLSNSQNSPASIATEQPGVLLSREESIKRLAPKLQEHWNTRK